MLNEFLVQYDKAIHALEEAEEEVDIQKIDTHTR